MIFDALNLYSDDQAITASAASAKLVDLGAVDSKIQSKVYRGNGKIIAVVTEDFNTLDSLNVAFRSAAAKTGTGSSVSLSSPVTHQSKTVLLANLKAGLIIDLGYIPEDSSRYTDLYYTVAGSNPSTGTIKAGIVLDTQLNGAI